ncbi:hypothetical protein [Nannocystis pusilla]|uniref:Uncharacterized protein n=1 Tax=Nannocystis pusilla TaxID=889268 RepID=A0ABS7TU28_9BACT|nr:hypothetical protein [Nannocystis pusilla]MBZ5711709.1 hypothetical protein [Nannocystis pusilla]
MANLTSAEIASATAQLQREFRARQAQIAAAEAAGEVVPYAPERTDDDGGFEVVGGHTPIAPAGLVRTK